MIRPPVGRVEWIVDARLRELLFAVRYLEQLDVTGLGFFSSDLGSMGNNHSGTGMGVPGATVGAAAGGSGGMTLWAMAVVTAVTNNAAQRMLMRFNS
jgi:hypothetical protein